MSVKHEHRYGIRPYCEGSRPCWALEKYVPRVVMGPFPWSRGSVVIDTVLVGIFNSAEAADKMIEHLSHPILLRA